MGIKGNPAGHSTFNNQMDYSFYNQACNGPQNLQLQHFPNSLNPLFDPRLNNVQRIHNAEFSFSNKSIANAKFDARESESFNTISPLTTSHVVRMDSHSAPLSTMEPLPFPDTSKSSMPMQNTGKWQFIDEDDSFPNDNLDSQIPQNKFVTSKDRTSAFQTSGLSFSSADTEIEPRPFTFQ